MHVIHQCENGNTVTSDTPKLDAYKQAAYIQNVLCRRYSLIAHADGSFVLVGDGLAAITFAPRSLTPDRA